MSARGSVFGLLVLLLHLWGAQSFPTLRPCPVPCLCQSDPRLNCSSLGLTQTPTPIPVDTISLNLSNNSLVSLFPLDSGRIEFKGLLRLWVGGNSLEDLSLVLKWSGQQECLSWAPGLQFLSAERNQLKSLPRGLGCTKSLQILHLSHNQISEINLEDVARCRRLSELHLQHNLITRVHLDSFVDLKELKVLDLSHNLLVTLPITTYQSLRNLNAQIDVSFNTWTCDCNLQTLRRWISFDTEVGNAFWQVICASPEHHAGKNLLHLEEADLTCLTPDASSYPVTHNIVVDEGTKIRISCSGTKDVINVDWLTPQGLINDQPELLLHDITEQHAGFYICTSQGNDIRVYDLRVNKKTNGFRSRRDTQDLLDVQPRLQINRAGETSTPTQSDFNLAVSLSVIITFIVAFILGVFLRPLLDKLWKRIRSKRGSSQTTIEDSHTEHPQYVNEGFSETDYYEREVRVGSKVTFGGVTVDERVPYYVTAPKTQSSDSSERSTEMEATYENVKKKDLRTNKATQQTLEVEDHRGKAESNDSIQEGKAVLDGKTLPSISVEETIKAQNNEVTRLEPISNGNQLKRSHSSSSTSSSDTQQSKERKESTEQSVDLPASTSSKRQPASEFTTERFTNWLTQVTNGSVDDWDPALWNDSGESFSFSDASSPTPGIPLTEDNPFRQEAESHRNSTGKETSVDNVKQDDRSDSESSSSSSQSDADRYSVNESVEEAETGERKSGAKLVDLKRFGTLEDVTLSGRTNPGLDDLIRQETITLDPTDIQMTLVREDSVDESIIIDPKLNREVARLPNTPDSSGKLPIDGVFADVGLGTVPKVKRYVEFTQSELASPSISPSAKDISSLEHTNETAFKSPSEESSKGVQKVKRYIEFKQTEPLVQTLPSPSGLVKVDEKRYNISSGEDGEVTKEDGAFFKTAVGASDEFPKVTRYILFKQFATEEEIKSPPVSSPNDSVKKYLYLEQFQPQSSSLPSSPSFTKKGILGKKSKRKHNRSVFGSHESLPLYHVHPVYRSQSRLNRGYNTDKSSSEDEEQFIDYPRKLHVKTDPEGNTPAITNKNSNNVLNIDFDNSSSSTDVFEKKNTKGLMKLRVFGARLFHKHEHEKVDKSHTDVGSTWDPGFSTNKRPPPTEDDLLGQGLSLEHLPKVKRYLQFSHSEVMTPDMIVPTETGKSSSSSGHENVNPDNQSEQISMPFAVIPKVNRYIEFLHTEPHSISTSTESKSEMSSTSSDEDDGKLVLNNDLIKNTSLAFDKLPKVKRHIEFTQFQPPSPPTTSSSKVHVEKEVKSDANVVQSPQNLSDTTLPLQKVKRYIQFKQSEPKSPDLPSTTIVNVEESRRYSTSSEDEDGKLVLDDNDVIKNTSLSFDKLPKVKRHIEFTQFKPPSPPTTSSSKVHVEKEVKSDANVVQSPQNLSDITLPLRKVKRYIQFKQSEPKSPDLPSTTIVNVEESRRYSTSSEEDDMLASDEDTSSENIASYIGVSKVKRSIAFKPFEKSSEPKPLAPKPTNNAIDSMEYGLGITSQNTEDFFSKIGISYDHLPKIERVLQFKSPETSMSVCSTRGDIIAKEVDTTSVPGPSFNGINHATTDNIFFEKFDLENLPQVKHSLQFKELLNYSPPSTSSNTPVELEVNTESTRSTISSEQDMKKAENDFSQSEASIRQIPKVKRYIQFKQPESQTQPIAETVSGSLKKTRLSSSSEDEAITSTEQYTKAEKQSFDKIPKVMRYIEFTMPDPSLDVQTSVTLDSKDLQQPPENRRESLTLSSSSDDEVMENTVFGSVGTHLFKIPEVRRYLQFTKAEVPLPIIPVKDNTYREETRQSSSKESQTVGSIGSSLDKIPKVKRYIQFKHPDCQISSKMISAPSTERLETSAIVGVRRSSTSSEDDVEQSNKVDSNTDTNLGHIPKVKRHLAFIHKPYSISLPEIPGSVKSTIVSGTQLKKPKSLSEDDLHHWNRLSSSFDTIPKVKRHLLFKSSESRSSTALTARIPESIRGPVVPQEAGLLVPSLENPYVKISEKTNHMEIPRVKRHIQFTQSDPYLSTPPSVLISTTLKDVTKLPQEPKRYVPSHQYNVGNYDATLDRIPKIRRHIQFTDPEEQKFSEYLTVAEPPPVPSTPLPSEPEDAREYLRLNSQVRQRLERRRLIEQKKKAMNEFDIASLSSIHDLPDVRAMEVSAASFQADERGSKASTGPSVSSRRTEPALIPTLQGLRTKDMTSLRSKSPESTTPKKEFLI